MGVRTLILPQLPWHGVRDLDITLPDNWDVQVCNMAGYDRPQLGFEEIREAVAAPLGMTPLRAYARGRKQVVVLFDDMTRITRAADIVPHVLEELAGAGIRDEQVRFICAGGCHGALERLDFEKKLGGDVLQRFPVYNHNPFDNCVYAGTTSAGTKIFLNAEFMACDLKIGIGSVVPHTMAGFGGGGKIVFPGVASYASILALHTPREKGTGFGVSGMGAIDGNPRRRDIDEGVAIAGLDMKIDALVNGRGETAALFAGAPGPCYAAALAEARRHYLTPPVSGKDIVIANSFAKASEAVSGLIVAFSSVKAGGDVVLIANAPEGQATHYLMGPFGNDIAGKLRLRLKIPEAVDRLILFSEYPELASRNYIEDDGRLVMASRWEDVLALLAGRYGPGAGVAVYPNADIQYCG